MHESDGESSVEGMSEGERGMVRVKCDDDKDGTGCECTGEA